MARQVTRESLVPVKLSPFNAESALEELEAEVTATDGFYVRSNFKVPSLSPADHRVTVAGRVARPLELSLDDLRDGYGRERLLRRGIPFRTDVYVVGEHLIWGATARILADLLDRLD
jgi:DMSO/TMAO reductase YedYZ molybdopterin-dependent catalytic subunit